MPLRSSADPYQKKYFIWLCNLVGVSRSKRRLRNWAWVLHQTDFIDLVPNDDNRAGDGKKLREVFSTVTRSSANLGNDPCSILELLIGLAIRIEHVLGTPETYDQTDRWFWEMVRNLGLILYQDDDLDESSKRKQNEEILGRFVRREYTDLGKGGLFPLKWAREDQRRVEIWYQMMVYLDQFHSI